MAFLPEAIMELSPVPDVIVLVECFKKEDREAILAGLIDLGYPVESNYYLKKNVRHRDHADQPVSSQVLGFHTL